MTIKDLINEFNNTKTICGIPVSVEQQRALKYAAIRLESLDELSSNEECEIIKTQRIGMNGKPIDEWDYKCSRCGANAYFYYDKGYCNCGAKIIKGSR